MSDDMVEVDVTKGSLKMKGRGHRNRQDGNDSEIGRGGEFESMDGGKKGAPTSWSRRALPFLRGGEEGRGEDRSVAATAPHAVGGPLKSVEGWIARRGVRPSVEGSEARVARERESGGCRAKGRVSSHSRCVCACVCAHSCRACLQVFASNVHEEAQEEDILDKFGEYGEVKNIHVNLDRRTGFVKGYALVEYANLNEAETAVAEMNGQDLLGQTLAVDWAFRKDGDSKRRRR